MRLKDINYFGRIDFEVEHQFATSRLKLGHGVSVDWTLWLAREGVEHNWKQWVQVQRRRVVYFVLVELSWFNSCL